MHHFDTDWLELARRAAVWRTLTPSTRRYLLTRKSTDFLLAAPLGDDLVRLEQERFVVHSGNGRIAIHPTHRDCARALRAMHRHDILRAPTAATLCAYLSDQYTVEERRRLLGYQFGYSTEAVSHLERQVSTAAWLAEPLASPEDGTEPLAPRHVALPGEDGALPDAAALVRLLLERGGVLPLHQLPDVIEPERAAPAVLAGLRRVWLLATMRADDLEPLLVLWPPTVARLRRPPPQLPAAELPVEEVCRSFLLDDAAAVLVAASAEPPRLRSNDYRMFAKAAERIATGFADLPPLLHGVSNWLRDVRLLAAVRMLTTLGHLRPAGLPGRDLRLEPTPLARAWLAASAADRLLAFADVVRRVGWSREPRPDAAAGAAVVLGPHGMYVADELADVDLDDVDFDDFDDDELDVDFAVHVPDLEAHVSVLPGYIAPSSLSTTVHHAIAAAYGEIPERGAVPLDAWFAYHARERNPLTDDRTGSAYVCGLSLQYATDEQREAHWDRLLGHVLVNWLLPLGGVRIARLRDGRTGVALTAVGRYMLGLTDHFDRTEALTIAGAAAGAHAPRIVVQPNFDIVFIAPSPAAEAEIGRFAQRTGNRVGTLFRITRDSVFTAAAAGVTAHDAIGALRELGTHAIPANVERELTDWFASCRRVHAAPAWLIRCPDEDTATRVLSAGGKDVRRVGPTVVELIEPKQRAALVRRLRKQGVFVDGFTAVERMPKRRGRSRY